MHRKQAPGAGSCKYAVNIKFIALLSGRTCAARILNVSSFFVVMMKSYKNVHCHVDTRDDD